MKKLQLAVSLVTLALSSTGVEAQKPADPDSGIAYETVTRLTMEGMPFNSVERTRTLETSRGTRVEVLERSGLGDMGAQHNPMMGGPGSYRLTLDGGRKMLGVDTVRREYFEFGFSDVSGMSSSMTKMIASMNMKMSGFKIDATDLGDGEPILGHPTHHWKLHHTMTTSVSGNTDTLAMSADMFVDTWFAKDIVPVAPQGPLNSPPERPDSAMMAFAQNFLGGDSAKTMEVYKKLPRTLPLKTVSAGSLQMGPMDFVMKTTTEITKFERGKFNAELFQVPKGYKLVEMPLPGMSSSERSPDRPF